VIVVADTSVLLNLCCVGQGGLFCQLFQEVVIPPAVAAEFARLAGSAGPFAGLKLPDGIRQQSPILLLPVVRSATGLDAGEAAALSLAVEIHADAVLIDERRGPRLPFNLGFGRLEYSASCCAQSPPVICLPCGPPWTICNGTRASGFPNRCGNKF